MQRDKIGRQWTRQRGERSKERKKENREMERD